MSSIAEHPVKTTTIAAATTGGGVSPYLEPARRAAQALVKAFPDYPNFWRLGHTFDTLIDYFNTTTDKTAAAAFADMVFERFLNRQCRPWADADTPRDPWRYGDHGWWGIAALRLGSAPALYGERAARLFLGVTERCWQPFYRNAPNVWRNAKWNEEWKACEPRIEGGVWNYAFSPRQIKGTPFTPGSPNHPGPLSCIQNTLTNALYWILMARLARARTKREDTPLRRAAQKICYFFVEWFQIHDFDECLLNYFREDDRKRALVRERVMTFDAYDQTGKRKKAYDEVNYDTDLAWTGDQGLVLGALVDQMALIDRNKDGGDYDELLDFFRQIAGGVKDHLVDPDTDLLWPWAFYSGPSKDCPFGDCDDYLTGVGVFMRYLCYAYRENADTKKVLNELGYPKVIVANADNVLKNPSKDDDFIGRTNDLATLLAALQVLA